MEATGIVCWVGVSLSLLGAAGSRLERLPADCPAVRQWFVDEDFIRSDETDLRLSHLLHRYRTCSGLPRPGLIDRYPSEQWLDEQIRFASGHIEYLESQRALTTTPARQTHLDEWIAEANWLREVYRELSWAAYHRQRTRCVVAVRQRLGTVQEMIGREALEQGLLPPVVQVWRFRRVR